MPENHSPTDGICAVCEAVCTARIEKGAPSPCTVLKEGVGTVHSAPCAALRHTSPSGHALYFVYFTLSHVPRPKWAMGDADMRRMHYACFLILLSVLSAPRELLYMYFLSVAHLLSAIGYLRLGMGE